MAVPVVASSTGVLNNTFTSCQVVFTKPASLAVGDLMTAEIWTASSSSATPTLPSGWAIPSGATTTFNATFLCQRYVAYKVADSGDVAASTFTFDIAAGPTPFLGFGVIKRITGAHATTPINGTPTNQTTTTGTTGTFPSATTTVASCLVLLSAGMVYNTGSTPSGSQFPYVAPSGTTLSTSVPDDSNLGYLGTSYFTQSAAGATGSKTVATPSLSSSNGIFQAVTLAIAPATQDGAGSSSGAGAAAGATQSTRASAGASAGTSSVTAVSGSIREAVGSAAGVGAATAVGTNGAAGTTDGVGAAAGVGAATGVSQATKAVAGSSAGVGVATGVGATVKASVGSSSGVGAATAVAQRIAQAVGAAAGTGAASGVGGSTRAAVGAASGVGSALGVAYVPATIISAVGSAAGVAVAAAIGSIRPASGPTSPDRIAYPAFEDRTVFVWGESRSALVAAEFRTVTAQGGQRLVAS